MDDLKRLIRDVPDFPKKGILFKDITTLLREPDGFSRAVRALAETCRPLKPDLVVCVESRGFGELRDPLDREDGAGESREERGLVAGAGADLEHALLAREPESLEHPRDRQGRREGLPEPERKRDLVVRLSL